MHHPRAPRSRSIGFKMTAMIDMAFLLITFFIMSIRFGQQGEERIKLPDADQAKQVTEERVDFVTVNVTQDGLYIVNGIQQSSSELRRYLQARKNIGERIEVVIRGDRRSPFSAIQRLMRMSVEVGIGEVSLAALQQFDEEAQ